MENKDLHKIIEERINDYASPLDVDVAWSAFGERKQREKDRRKRYFLLLLFLFLLFGTCTVFYFGTDQVTGGKTNAFAMEKESGITPLEREEKQITHQGITDSQLSIIDKAESTSPLTKRERKSEVELASSRVTELKKLKKLEENFYEQQAETSVLGTKGEEGNKEVANSETVTINEKSTKITKEVKSTLSEVASINSKTIANTSSSKEAQQKFIIPFVAQRSLELLEKRTPRQKLYFHQLTKPPSAVRTSRKLETYVLGGLYRSQQKFSATKSEAEAYQERRSNSETNLETYALELGINYYLAKRSFIGFGIHYAQWYDRLDIQYDRERVYEFENVVVKTIKRQPQGTIDEIYGDTTIVGVETVLAKYYNTYTTISGSLIFGHYFLQKNRFLLGLSGGLNYNFQAETKGKIAAGTGEEMVINNDNYRAAFGLGVAMNIHLDYKINARLYLEVRPGANYWLSSITKDNDRLQAHLYQFGLMTGLKYRF